MEKILDGINSLEDKILYDHIQLSYKIYKSESKNKKQNKKNQNQISEKYDISILSSLVRFYRYINNSMYIDSETLKEILKSKSLSYNQISENLNEILSIQNKRIYISNSLVSQSKNEEKSFSYIKYNPNSIKSIYDIKWRINLIISNSDMNKVLIPQVILIFYYEDFSFDRFIVPINVFQEMRKNMTRHLKKVIENDHVTLLNN